VKVFKIVASAWILLVAVVVGAAARSESSSRTPARPSTPTAEVTGLGEAGMLEADMRMLEQMRTALSPSMMSDMTAVDLMWVDPDMVRAHEEYQAQIDRMLARR
jgi:hypothetical protein